MKVVIIEDEIPAIDKLKKCLLEVDASVEVVACLYSIGEAVEWFNTNENSFDIAFMDVQLTDGQSFEIFNHVEIAKPIIFITAYDEYALEAFKVNSIAYVLKPITTSEIAKALNKLQSFKTQLTSDILKLATAGLRKRYKERFLVKLGNHIHSVPVNQIDCFYAEGRTVFLLTSEGKKFIIDSKLEDLENSIDEKLFFRVNRSFIIRFLAIKDVVVYSERRLKIKINQNIDEDIIVSRGRVTAFKKWFEGDY